MPQYNFQAHFAPAVEAREKRQTVRAVRKNPPRAGQLAYLYTGLRTAAARLLGPVEQITRVETIRISEASEIELEDTADGGFFLLNGYDADGFARADGFADAAEFVGWIRDTHGLPFEGTVTYW